MNTPYMTTAQKLDRYKRNAPADLVASMEGFISQMSGYADILRDPMALYTPDMADVTANVALESVSNSTGLQLFGDQAYEKNAMVFLESMTEDEDEVSEAVGMSDLHRGNLKRLMENSSIEMRSANQRGIGELTPYDAFLPFAIIRTYLPLIGKDLIPYIVPKQHFIRIKQQYKYIVTKDNQKYLEPDVYSDYKATMDILKSAKGGRVTETWYPEDAAEKQSSTDGADFVEDVYDETTKKMVATGFKFKSGGVFRVEELDLLGESGGVRETGDALDINVCIDGVRCMVTNSEGKSYMVEMTGLQHYLDTTAISPKNQIGGKVRIPVKNSTGAVERYLEDVLMAQYDPYTSKVNVVSLHGLVKQVRFGGNLSNKNNQEYISFHDEYDSWQHPIPEGYRSNMPITVEDTRLYNETGSIDIIAYGINRMTEMFTNMEDTSIVARIDETAQKWKNVKDHDFEHFRKGPVYISHTVNVTYDNTNPFMKKLDYIQDRISNDLNGIIRDLRTTCQNEPFRLVAYCHPNIASLFVGDKVNWTINNGDTIMGGIRSDYAMGITTQDGNVMRILTSMKFREEDGLCGLAFPVNEQNFLTWKHFKRALYFDRDHHVREMSNNPNIMCVATFHTQEYVPMGFQLKIKGYRNASPDEIADAAGGNNSGATNPDDGKGGTGGTSGTGAGEGGGTP